MNKFPQDAKPYQVSKAMEAHVTSEEVLKSQIGMSLAARALALNEHHNLGLTRFKLSDIYRRQGVTRKLLGKPKPPAVNLTVSSDRERVNQVRDQLSAHQESLILFIDEAVFSPNSYRGSYWTPRGMSFN